MKPHEQKIRQVQNKSVKEGAKKKEKERVIKKPNQKRRKHNKT
jgi:hypothetical protein